MDVSQRKALSILFDFCGFSRQQSPKINNNHFFFPFKELVELSKLIFKLFQNKIEDTFSYTVLFLK